MNDVKPEFYWKLRKWNWFVLPFLKFIATGWKKQPLVYYPLIVELELGEFIKFNYFKFGFRFALNIVQNFNSILVDRINKVEYPDFSTEFLTEDSILNRQLEKEIEEITTEDY